MSVRRSVVAVDLGATSGRVLLVHLDGTKISTQEIRRFSNAPIESQDRSLRWNWPRIVEEVRLGLDVAIASADVASIGIDAWGVDYGLVEENGRLAELPYSYRDRRTANWRDVIDRLGAETIYRTTGIQLMPINTLVQLALHERTILERARSVLLIPELMIHSLSGAICAEHTSAGTTQLYDARKREWSAELCAAIGVPLQIMPRIQRAGTRVGEYTGVPIMLVGGHDTASAVAALPAGPGASVAYLSSGTWSLIGIELDEPELGPNAFRLNFTNERGVFGTIRFLKNVMGLWMFDECLREWGLPRDEALALAASGPYVGPIVDATDERFLNPTSMEKEIRLAAPEAGESKGELIRCILESLAYAYGKVVRQIEETTGQSPEVLHVIGGGSGIELLNQLTARATGIPVVAGPAEATSIGNGIVQLIAHGWLTDLEEGRAVVRASVPLRRHDPD